MNCYHTWGWAVEELLFVCLCVCSWPCVWVCVCPCVLVMYALLCTCTSSRIAVALLGQIWVICRITGSPKWPVLTGTINQNIVGALGQGRGFMLRLHLQGLELHWDPVHLHTMIFKWSMAGWTTFISSIEASVCKKISFVQTKNKIICMARCHKGNWENNFFYLVEPIP